MTGKRYLPLLFAMLPASAGALPMPPPQTFTGEGWTLTVGSTTDPLSFMPWVIELDLEMIVQGELKTLHYTTGMDAPVRTWDTATLSDGGWRGFVIHLQAPDFGASFGFAPLGEFAVPEPGAALAFGLGLLLTGRRLRAKDRLA